MKKRAYFLLSLAMVSIGMLWVLNLKVTTRYGINYVQYEKKIPLYLKATRFVTRHLEMKFLMNDIISDKPSQKEKLEALFQWVIQNIKLHPPNMPVIDDHPWPIIVRGYGDHDQLNDVFSLMAMVAGFKACYTVLVQPVKKNRYPMAFVFYQDRWIAFDLKQKKAFFDVPGVVITDDCLKRNLGQFPLKRLWWEIKNYTSLKQ